MELISNDLKIKNNHYLNNVEKCNIASIQVIPGKYKKQLKMEYVVSFEKELKGFYSELTTKAQSQYKQDYITIVVKSNLIKDDLNVIICWLTGENRHNVNSL